MLYILGRDSKERVRFPLIKLLACLCESEKFCKR